MAVLRLKVDTKKMPHTSEFFAVVKAVEHFYYALLFSTDASYKGRPDPWVSWVEQGFSAAIREAPPDTGETDRLTTSVHSDGKIIEMTASSLNVDVLDKVARVLAAVDAQRAATVGQAQDGGPSGDVEEQLLGPVSAGLQSSGVDSRVSGAIMDVLSAGIRALTYRDIESIDVTAGVDAR